MKDHTIIISTGTLNPRHLIPVFSDYLAADWPNRLRLIQGNFIEAVMDDEPLDECIHHLLDDLMRALDDAAPEGTYFGSHEGDGACIGFWQVASPPEEDEA